MKRIFVIMIIMVIMVGGSGFLSSCSSQSGQNNKTTQTATTGKDLYVCPMHPNETSDKPGECPICGMDLVKKELKPDSTKIKNQDSIKIK